MNNIEDTRHESSTAPLSEDEPHHSASESLGIRLGDITREHPIERVLANYLRVMRGIGQTAEIVLPHISKWLLEELEKAEKKLMQFPAERSKESKTAKITFKSARNLAELMETVRQIEELQNNQAPIVLSRSLFMQLFSEFDAFTGALLKEVYSRKQDLLKGISREISLTDLLEYEDLESVKRAMLDKEIETFRRDSYIEQFATLEKKFDLPLRDFKEWPEFVEFSQRRNIFTHNGGAVNEQYLVTCERAGYKFLDRPNIGDILDVHPDYFFRAIRVISKIGFMLTFTLWSKVYPKEIQEIHKALNDALYECLEQEQWTFVGELQDFALSGPMRRGISELTHRIRLVNIAIGLKFSDKSHEACKLVSSLDWTASYRDFKLAIAVLEENYVQATNIMESIGKTGEIVNQTYYHAWPLFARFREQPDFHTTYEKIYGEPYLSKDKSELSSAATDVRPTVQEVDIDLIPDVQASTNGAKLTAKTPRRARKKASTELKT